MVDISICIPVYKTEKYLEQCLDSILLQSFKRYEVIVVNDGSNYKDNYYRSSLDIVKEYRKKHKISIRYIEHSENKGVLEARRTAVFEARGKYIFMLDSDDTMTSNALSSLYNAITQNDYDVAIANANICVEKTQGTDPLTLKKRVRSIEEKIGKIEEEYTLSSSDIFDSFLVKKSYNGFLWNKLIKTNLYRRAFDHIPPMFCILADDLIQYFWISYFAQSFIAIPDYVYNYNLTNGFSSKEIIETLDKWEKICATSSVFTGINQTIIDNHISLTSKERDSLYSLSKLYLKGNLLRLKNYVTKDIKEDAYKLLCDYWGKEIVSSVEEML